MTIKATRPTCPVFTPSARSRQSRSRGQWLCNQHGCAGHPGCDAEEQDIHQPVRARCQLGIQISAVLLLHSDRWSEPKANYHRGFLSGGGCAKPEAKNLAIAAEDAEFSRNAAEGARANAKQYGFDIVYDKSYPPNTTDFSPVIRAIQASNPDLLVICSYPLSSVGMLLSANELGLKPKMMGGAMVGLQATAIKDKLKAKLNGVINYDNWVPSAKLMTSAADFFKKYQARAAGQGVDPLGYYLGGWGYAYLQVLAQAVEGTKSIDDAKLADYLGNNAVNSIMAEGVRFGKNGEWVKDHQLQVQYHDITDAANLETWRGMSYQTVLMPADDKTGDVIYPYANAVKA